MISIIAILILDFYLYMIHRAMHRFRYLWLFHRVHHAAYAPNFHLAEFTLLWLVPMAVCWAFGLNGLAIIIAFLFVYEVTLTHRIVYSTSNPIHRFLFKKVKFFIGNAKFHKVHHDHPNKNYSQLFIFWDVICGTKKVGT